MQGCISNDSGVQSAIREIHASVARGPYKKRKENPSNETETTPPPPAVRVRPLVTNEASDSSPSLQQANDLEAQQQSWISSAPIIPRIDQHNKLNGIDLVALFAVLVL